MKELTHIDPGALICEIARYLAAIDVFRAERCEPTWLPEPVAAGALSGRQLICFTTGSRTSGTHRP